MADIFVDPSATYNGDGTTAAQATEDAGVGAYNSFQNATIADGDVLWLRRTSTNDTLSARHTVSVNQKFVGWPEEGDYGYEVRPQSGIDEGWDSDTEEYYTIETSYLDFYVATTGVVFLASKIFFNRTSGSASYAQFTIGSVFAFLYDIKIVAPESLSASSCLLKTNVGTKLFSKKLQLSSAVDATSTTVPIIYLYGQFSSHEDITVNIAKLADPSDGCGFYMNSDFSIYKNVAITMIVADNTSGSTYFCVLSGAENYIGRMSIDNTISETDSNLPRIVVNGTNNKVDLIEVSGGVSTFEVTGNYNVISLKGGIFSSSITVSGDGNTIILEDCECVNTSDTLNFIQITGDGNTIICKNINAGTQTECEVTGENSVIMYNNYGLTTGLWAAFTATSEAYSSSVVRTGGESFSIRHEIVNSITEYANMMFGTDTGEVLWASLSSGTVTIEFYIATKILDSLFAASTFNIIVEQEMSDGYKKLEMESSSLETDTSTWTGDTDLTMYKISITFTCEKDQVVPIRMVGHWDYVSGGYLYLDPKPVISYA